MSSYLVGVLSDKVSLTINGKENVWLSSEQAKNLAKQLLVMAKVVNGVPIQEALQRVNEEVSEET